MYGFVPTQDWTKQWTDSDLYAKYKLTASEIAFIEKIVRPLGANDVEPDAEDDSTDE